MPGIASKVRATLEIDPQSCAGGNNHGADRSNRARSAAGMPPRWAKSCCGSIPARAASARRAQFQVWEGGGEYNVVRGLRRCFGLRTTVVTAIVDNEVGRLLEDLMLQGGVDLSHVKWVPFDGIGRAARVGLNFTERGYGVRRSGGLLGPRLVGGLAAQARRRGLEAALRRGGRALVPLRRDLRGALPPPRPTWPSRPSRRPARPARWSPTT